MMIKHYRPIVPRVEACIRAYNWGVEAKTKNTSKASNPYRNERKNKPSARWLMVYWDRGWQHQHDFGIAVSPWQDNPCSDLQMHMLLDSTEEQGQ